MTSAIHRHIVEEALKTLKGVESGEVRIQALWKSWHEMYCGNVTFVTDTGWTIVIFNDCDEWDYLNTMVAPFGETMDYDTISNVSELGDYKPDNTDMWTNAPLIKF